MHVHVRCWVWVRYTHIHPLANPPTFTNTPKGMACRWVVKCDDDVHADPRGLLAAIDALPQVREELMSDDDAVCTDRGVSVV